MIPVMPMHSRMRSYILSEKTFSDENTLIRPRYKHLASFQGDLAFEAPRGFFLKVASKTRNTWTFRTSRSLSLVSDFNFCLGMRDSLLSGLNSIFRGISGAAQRLYLVHSHGGDIPEVYADSSTENDFIGTDIIDKRS